MMEHPIPDSYWVIPGKLLAGAYPGDSDDVAARRKLNTLLDAGVTAFVDLTEAGEYDLRPYWPLLQDLAEQRSITVSYRRLSIADFAVPTAVSMAAILATIDETLAAGQAVYVHCFGGIGRTGTVVGCFLVRYGMTGEQALAAIAARRVGTLNADKRSPETEAQRALVLAWGAEGCQRILGAD